MLRSIANLKENLNKIALDVLDDDDDDELSMYSSPPHRDGSIPDSDRRISRNFSHSRSPTPTTANGFDSPYKSEVFFF